MLAISSNATLTNGKMTDIEVFARFKNIGNDLFDVEFEVKLEAELERVKNEILQYRTMAMGALPVGNSSD